MPCLALPCSTFSCLTPDDAAFYCHVYAEDWVNCYIQLRNITVTPALHNVNGGTYHRGTIYVTTNGSPVRGVYTLQVFPNDTAIATPVVNNYRGRKLNRCVPLDSTSILGVRYADRSYIYSPNDIIADRNGNLWFTGKYIVYIYD